MKRVLSVIVVLILCAAFVLPSDLPPPLPSSFYGTITGAIPGAVVTATVRGTMRWTTAFTYQGKVVYAIDAEGGLDKDTVTFKVNGIEAGKGVYKTGRNQMLNLVVKPRKKIVIYRQR